MYTDQRISTTLHYLQTASLGELLVLGSQAECTLQGLRRDGEPLIAWVQLTGQLAVTRS